MCCCGGRRRGEFECEVERERRGAVRAGRGQDKGDRNGWVSVRLTAHVVRDVWLIDQGC